MITNAMIAKVCHEANRSYCESIGDNSQQSWENAPDWQKQSAISGVNFHLFNLASGRKPEPSASHDAWLFEKQQDGWSYGLTKDATKKEHPCYVPYEQLPIEQQLKDYIFAGIVEAFYRAAAPDLTPAAPEPTESTEIAAARKDK